MKHAQISQLKAHLSAYLADVRNGDTVLVSDRRTPVARLVPMEQRPEGIVIHRAKRPAAALRRVRGVPLRRRIDVGKVLRDSRDER